MASRIRCEVTPHLVLAQMFRVRSARPARFLIKTMGKTTTKTAKVTQIRDKSAVIPARTRFLFVPYIRQMREKLRKDVGNTAQFWIPVETSLLIQYNFVTLLPHSRYIYVAILLHCGATGSEEIPTDTRFLANIFGVDERTISKSLDELENAKLLVERKKEREEKTHTTEQTDDSESVVVSVDFNSFSGTKTKGETENQSEEKTFGSNSDPAVNGNRSRFTLKDCLKYAQASDGVKNPNALANNLFQTGNADAFIMAMLYPNDAKEADAKVYGQPINFKSEPCSICFGAKLADTDGKGYRKCVHCKNERGQATGFEPKGESE